MSCPMTFVPPRDIKHVSYGLCIDLHTHFFFIDPRRPPDSVPTLRFFLSSICYSSAAFFMPVGSKSFVAQQRVSTRSSVAPVRMAEATPELENEVSYHQSTPYCQKVA